MSNTSSKHTIEVTDNGSMAKLTKEGKLLNTTLDQVAKPRMTAAAKSAYAAGSGSVATDTNYSRGVMGATGAAGRDFAAQAQGLGGLVHIYATFAANIFAVSAAFTALSKAADLSNMIQGLDQLGAASGRGLSTLAKRLVDVSDGALSMKDAMSSTALATSGGMAGKDILRMTEVAKKASQALGRDMPDAMDRITKGIVKTQPELLDELGIMARVIPAQQAYALQIGKSVSALTEFEKKQAFANAVLKEGEDKFGAIELSANPYSKILASFVNISFSALEKFNKALSPIIDILASSPLALGSVIAGFAAMLLSKAIPALSQWRGSLLESSKQAAETAKNLATMHEQFQINKSLANIDEVTGPLHSAVADNVSQIQKKLGEALPASSKLIANSLSSAFDLEKEVPKYKRAIDRMGKELGTLNNKLKEDTSLDQKQQQVLQDQIATLEGKKKIMEDIHNTGVATLGIQKKAVELEHNSLENLSNTKADYFSIEASLKRRSDSATNTATKLGIYANVAQNTQTMGLKESLRTMYDEINDSKLSKTQKVVTKVSGTIRGLAGSAMTVVGSLGNVGMAVGVLVGTFEALDSMLSTNSKEAAATAAAFDTLKAAGDAVDATLSYINKKDPLYSISPKAMAAKASSFKEVSDGLLDAFDKVNTQISKAGWWDNSINAIKSIFGQGILSQSSKNFAYAISQSLKLAGSSKEASKFKEVISSTLNVDPKDSKALEKALDKDFLKLVPKMTEAMKDLSNELNNVASKATEVNDAFTTASKTYDTIMTSLLPTDNLAKLGFEMVTLGQKMTKAFEDPATQLSQLIDISKDLSKLRFLDPATAQNLMNDSKEFEVLATAVTKYKDIVEDLKNQQEIAKRSFETKDYLKKDGTIGQMFSGSPRGLANAESLGKQIKAIETAIAEMEPELNKFIEKYTDAQKVAIVRGSELLKASIDEGFAKASITIAKAYANLLGNTTAGIEEKTRLDNALIDLQIRQIDASISLVKAMDSLRATQNDAIIESKSKAALAETDPIKQVEMQKELSKMKKVRDNENLFKNLNATELSSLVSSKDKEVSQAAANRLAVAQSLEAGRANRSQSLANKSANTIGMKSAVTTHEEVDLVKQAKEVEAASLELDKARLDIAISNSLYTTQEDARNKNILDNKIAINKTSQENLVYEDNIRKARDAFLATTEGSVAEEKALAGWKETQLTLEQKLARDTDALENRKLGYATNMTNALKAEREYRENIKKLIFDSEIKATETAVSIEEEKLAILVATGSISEERILDITKQNNLIKEQIRYVREVTDLTDKYNKDIAEGTKKRDALPEGAARNAATEDLNNTYNLYSRAYDGATALNRAKVEGLSITGAEKKRMDEYVSFFKSSVDSMSDALVDFAVTGSQSFDKMIGDMLIGLAKLELKMQMQALWANAKGTEGVAGFFSGLFGGGSSGAATDSSYINTSGMEITTPARVGMLAQGAAYDAGMQKFAMGGTFTNSIVGSPTLFKFAHGTGLMGEAGPEAIMPLKRDSQGNLGVRTNQQNSQTNVVVNNYTTAKAETKETVDSRGNRKIEVTIGDMVAGEIQRFGSATQQSLKGTFGRTPALIRR